MIQEYFAFTDFGFVFIDVGFHLNYGFRKMCVKQFFFYIIFILKYVDSKISKIAYKFFWDLAEIFLFLLNYNEICAHSLLLGEQNNKRKFSPKKNKFSQK